MYILRTLTVVVLYKYLEVDSSGTSFRDNKSYNPWSSKWERKKNVHVAIILLTTISTLGDWVKWVEHCL